MKVGAYLELSRSSNRALGIYLININISLNKQARNCYADPKFISLVKFEPLGSQTLFRYLLGMGLDNRFIAMAYGYQIGK